MGGTPQLIKRRRCTTAGRRATAAPTASSPSTPPASGTGTSGRSTTSSPTSIAGTHIVVKIPNSLKGLQSNPPYLIFHIRVDLQGDTDTLRQTFVNFNYKVPPPLLTCDANSARFQPAWQEVEQGKSKQNLVSGSQCHPVQ